GGVDIYCATGGIINPLGTLKILIKNRFYIPPGFKATVHPRSRTATRGLCVHTTVIDAEYSGEVYIVVTNLTRLPITYSENERLAQLIFSPVTPVFFKVSDVFVKLMDETSRGTNGFGSTGV
ncbi:deoxyuridine 5'-triphosphate nucleotidohydrolase-like protein, partial [Leptotrombidium deliense]